MSDFKGLEVWRGSVNTWECDAMGHMNVRFYGVRALEGLVGLAAAMGMPRAFSPTAGATLLVREQHIRFLREALAGTVLTLRGWVAELGETEARLVQDGSGYAVIEGSISREGKKIAQAEIRYGVVPFPNETLRAQMLETARRVGVPEEFF